MKEIKENVFRVSKAEFARLVENRGPRDYGSVVRNSLRNGYQVIASYGPRACPSLNNIHSAVLLRMGSPVAYYWARRGVEFDDVLLCNGWTR